MEKEHVKGVCCQKVHEQKGLNCKSLSRRRSAMVLVLLTLTLTLTLGLRLAQQCFKSILVT